VGLPYVHDCGGRGRVGKIKDVLYQTSDIGPLASHGCRARAADLARTTMTPAGIWRPAEYFASGVPWTFRAHPQYYYLMFTATCVNLVSPSSGHPPR
jgi:hypothetical protein